jgi:hypothetical protein
MMKKEREKQWRKVRHSSVSNESLLAFHQAEVGEYAWLDGLWHTLTIKQRMDALLPYKDDKGRGLLSMTVRHGEIPSLGTLLLNPSVCVNEKDIYGNTALHHAVLVKDSGALSVLLNSPRVNTAVENQDKHNVGDLLAAYEKSNVFPDSVVMHSFVRLHMDQLIINYCHTHATQVMESEGKTTLRETIRQLYETAWFYTQYRDRPFPLHVVSTETQNEIIEQRFIEYREQRKKKKQT